MKVSKIKKDFVVVKGQGRLDEDKRPVTLNIYNCTLEKLKDLRTLTGIPIVKLADMMVEFCMERLKVIDISTIGEEKSDD